jgi:cytochrome c
MKLVIVSCLAFFVAGVATAEERATTKDAERMVHSAVAFYKKEGADKALKVFSDPKGAFSFRDLYIFAYKTDGTCVAHGQSADRVGKNLLDSKDADGKAFVKERIDLAKSKGKGWQEYKFKNPATGKVEQKVAYVELVDDVIIGCGAYKP